MRSLLELDELALKKKERLQAREPAAAFQPAASLAPLLQEFNLQHLGAIRNAA